MSFIHYLSVQSIYLALLNVRLKSIFLKNIVIIDGGANVLFFHIYGYRCMGCKLTRFSSNIK